MIDNAPYHRARSTISSVTDLKIPIMFLGPY